MVTDHDFIVAMTVYLIRKSVPSFGNLGQDMQPMLDKEVSIIF